MIKLLFKLKKNKNEWASSTTLSSYSLPDESSFNISEVPLSSAARKSQNDLGIVERSSSF